LQNLAGDQAHAARLRNLDDAVLSSRNAATKAMIAWDLYRLQDLEVAQVQAASALLDAEATCLTLPPTTLAGSIAVLMFLKDYLKAEPDLSLAVIGVGNVAAMLSTVA
jgi:hypothetical protein